MKPCVTVFGSSRPRPGEAAYQLAYELGRSVARSGWSLCNGGYGGTMEAAARGALSEGGHTIGVLCSKFRTRRPNRYLRETVRARTLFERLDVLLARGSAFVVLPGGPGTLLELAAVIELTRQRAIRRRPVILLGGHWQAVVAAVRTEVRSLNGVRRVESVEHAIARLASQFLRTSPSRAGVSN